MKSAREQLREFEKADWREKTEAIRSKDKASTTKTLRFLVEITMPKGDNITEAYIQESIEAYLQEDPGRQSVIVKSIDS